MYFMSQWSSPCSVHWCCAWQYSYSALPNFVSNSSAPRKASTCFHTFQDSIIRSVDKPVQARVLLLATSIPYSKCWYTAGWALCKLRMALKQILADLTQETANYTGGSSGGLRGLQPPLNFREKILIIRVAAVIDLPAWPLR